MIDVAHALRERVEHKLRPRKRLFEQRVNDAGRRRVSKKPGAYHFLTDLRVRNATLTLPGEEGEEVVRDACGDTVALAVKPRPAAQQDQSAHEVRTFLCRHQRDVRADPVRDHGGGPKGQTLRQRAQIGGRGRGGIAGARLGR